MRIDLNSSATVSGSQLEKTSSPPPSHTSASQSEPSQLHESQASVGKLATAALSAPEVRTEKVQALQSQLQSGTYQVSAQQVAGSIVDQMRVRS